MSGEPQIVHLNENQRRHFQILFARLEESLSRIESLMDPTASGKDMLAVSEDDVPSVFRQNAPPVLGSLRHEIQQLASVLDLRAVRVSRRRSIAAILTAEAVRFEDSLAAQLRGYGPVDESVPRWLDPRLLEIAGTLAALARSLKGHTRSRE